MYSDFFYGEMYDMTCQMKLMQMKTNIFFSEWHYYIF